MANPLPDLDELVVHDETEDCNVCMARDLSVSVLVPAVAVWEATHGLARCSLALHGAAGLLAMMIGEGFTRAEIDHELSLQLDAIGEAKAQRTMLSGCRVEGNA